MLKQCKAEGKTYYESQQLLTQQGYSQAEIEQASYQFPYSGITSTEPSPAQNPVAPQPTNAQEIGKDIELQTAKQKMNQDYWYGMIPIIGTFFRYKRIGDYANYESLKTGQHKSNVVLIWIMVMIVGFVLAVFVAPWLVGLVTDSSLLIYVSHYVGVLVAVLLLMYIFGRRKSDGD